MPPFLGKKVNQPSKQIEKWFNIVYKAFRGKLQKKNTLEKDS